MRRKDREVTDESCIEEIIENCDCLRLGLADGDRPYIVPLNFGWHRNNNKLVFYFHGAKEGRKIDLINKNQYAGFELDTNHLLITHDTACGHAFRFQSIIGAGTVEMVEEHEEKAAALRLIMKHHTKKDEWEIPRQMADAVAVIKLTADEYACKEHE